MSQRLLAPTARIVAAVAAVAGVTHGAHAQQAPRSHAAAPMGTYAAGTKRLPSSGRDGCWLEAAPMTADSLHVQILCRYPAPGHHVGVLDARLPISGDSAVYEPPLTSDQCRIRIRFAEARALVAQHGSDVACGFGAFVDVSGTYSRLSSGRPPFDLAPIERLSTPRGAERRPRSRGAAP